MNEATGQAARFLSILEEYRKAPEVTRQRIFLEAMEDVLPDVTKFVVDNGQGGGSLLQFLNLNEGAPFQSSPSSRQPSPGSNQ